MAVAIRATVLENQNIEVIDDQGGVTIYARGDPAPNDTPEQHFRIDNTIGMFGITREPDVLQQEGQGLPKRCVVVIHGGGRWYYNRINYTPPA